jgi:hypothetical protein
MVENIFTRAEPKITAEQTYSLRPDKNSLGTKNK